MMAVGNKRGSKRSSSSYTSTITTIVFIGLCVLGVWMLSTNSFGPPQAATTVLSSDKKDQTTTVFEDNPEYIPNDANIQTDDAKQNDNAAAAGGGEDKKDEESVASGGGDGDSKNEEAKVVEEAGLQGEGNKESAEEQDKQKEGQTQISEESTMTQNQQQQADDQNQQTIASQDSQNQEQQQQETQVDETNKDSQNEKMNDEMITQQMQENAGKQTAEISQENQDSQNQERQQQEIQVAETSKESQNEKTNDEMITQQMQENAGKQTAEISQENQDSQNQEQQQQEIQVAETSKVSRNEKTNEGMITQQMQENAGKQTAEILPENQDSQNQDQQQQDIQVAETSKESHNEKTNEEMITQQIQEDAGKQTAEILPENQISDEEQQRIQQQQENPQNPDETNTNPKEPASQEAMQTAAETTEIPQQSSSSSVTESQEETTTQEPDTSKDGNQNQEGPAKNERQRTKEHKPTTSGPDEPVPATSGSKPGIPKESTESKKSWSTQAKQSANEKERREDESKDKENIYGYTWHLCNESSGSDFIPCLDNEAAIRKLTGRHHYEHRERHCPEEGPTCLVPLPEGYKTPIKWPHSRDKIWYRNVPHKKLADFKGHQNWVKVTGEFLTFPGGGTQFIHGALHYIDVIQEAVPEIAWGKNTRVVLDVGCGVASFGGFLFDRDVLTMSFAPKDEHEAQVQFALERGIPAISAVMGTQRLPFPSKVFDLLHCARCRVPWHIEGGMLLLELNRVLRPGGYFVWSATPVYRKDEEDAGIWRAMSSLTESMCWEVVTIRMDEINSAGFVVYRKPTTNKCYEKRKEKTPPLCKSDDDPNAAWYVPLQACLHRLADNKDERGTSWPEKWPLRLQTPPYWLNKSQMGIYGKPAPEDFSQDYQHWKRVVSDTYMSGLGISWSDVRSVMDMRAVYGGFASALKDLQVWVMNVVNIDSPDTLPMIYERGLFGIYHDWCESFSTYPRTYDLLHADHLFSKLKKKCKLAPVMAEVDRIVRPGGKLIVRDESSAIGEVENLLKSLRWEVHLTFSKDQEGILSAQKGNWRPDTFQAAS